LSRKGDSSVSIGWSLHFLSAFLAFIALHALRALRWMETPLHLLWQCRLLTTVLSFLFYFYFFLGGVFF